MGSWSLSIPAPTDPFRNIFRNTFCLLNQIPAVLHALQGAKPSAHLSPGELQHWDGGGKRSIWGKQHLPESWKSGSLFFPGWAMCTINPKGCTLPSMPRLA